MTHTNKSYAPCAWKEEYALGDWSWMGHNTDSRFPNEIFVIAIVKSRVLNGWNIWSFSGNLGDELEPRTNSVLYDKLSHAISVVEPLVKKKELGNFVDMLSTKYCLVHSKTVAKANAKLLYKKLVKNNHWLKSDKHLVKNVLVIGDMIVSCIDNSAFPDKFDVGVEYIGFTAHSISTSFENVTKQIRVEDKFGVPHYCSPSKCFRFVSQI